MSHLTIRFSRRSLSAMASLEASKRKLPEDVVSRLTSRDLKVLRTKKGNQTDQDILDTKYCETDYYFAGYLRKVYPYFFRYKTFCKQRWVGRKLAEVLETEFRSLPPGSLENRIKTGSLRVNEKIVDMDYVLKDNDRISNRDHRHELPVLASPIQIVHEDDDVLVINKPPSLPVHPCGRYRFNSTVAILRKEYNYKDLHVIHRLDRLTSGILILAKNRQTSLKLHSAIADRCVRKEYLCRVVGNFPDDEVTVDQPLDVLCKRIGASFITKEGKESVTLFKKLSFNGKSSLVHCFPRTGRTHQIRVHLQFLGHPIVNDPLYNSPAFGQRMGKDADYGMSQEELLLSIRKEHTVDDWYDYRSDDCEADAGHEESIKSFLGAEFAVREPGFDASKVTRDAGCEECDVRYKEPDPKHMMLFLHALKYSGSDWSYETRPPFWADDGYDFL